MIDLPANALSIPENVSREGEMPRQVFLHSTCSGVKKPYLMRFWREGADTRYQAVASHVLPVVEAGDADLLPPINSSMLRGVPECPYCLNAGAGLCGCGALFCVGDASQPIDCPGCGKHLSGSTGNSSFDIDRVQG